MGDRDRVKRDGETRQVLRAPEIRRCTTTPSLLLEDFSLREKPVGQRLVFNLGAIREPRARTSLGGECLLSSSCRVRIAPTNGVKSAPPVAIADLRRASLRIDGLERDVEL